MLMNKVFWLELAIRVLSVDVKSWNILLLYMHKIYIA